MPGNLTDAEFSTKYLFEVAYAWAGWALLVGLVVAALYAMGGRYQVAFGIAGGCCILYGGIYLLAMVRDSMQYGPIFGIF